MSQDSKSLYFPIRITSNLLLELSIELKDLLKDILNLLRAQLLDQFRFPDINMVQYILQIQLFTCPTHSSRRHLSWLEVLFGIR